MANNMANPGNRQLRAVPFLKLLLILGVVEIHCNIRSFLPPVYSPAGLDIVVFIVSLMKVCVPSFFIISGYLFFYGVNGFTPGIYKKKLIRRVKTLLIPYLLWNAFCAGLFLFKVFVLKFPGLGIIENGTIDWGEFFKGFISIDQAQGFPYAFAFWFIRDLIVFVILTPAVWLVARKWWSTALFFVIKIVFDINTFGIEWFILGAACSLNRVSFEDVKISKALTAAAFVIFLSSAVAADYLKLPEALYTVLFMVEVMAAFCFLYSVSLRFIQCHNGKRLHFLYSATFFIYAFHQCFCSVNVKFWVHLFGCGTVLSSLAVFLSSFIAAVSISLTVYVLMRRIAPRFLDVITGDRAQNS